MSRLPPGSALPLLQPLRYLKDPYALFRASQAKYGDPFTARTSARMVVTGDPAGVRTIFEADQEDFTIHLPRIQKVILGEHSMTNTTGQAHKRERKVIGPPFQGRAMRACGRMIQDMPLQAVDRWAPGQRLVVRDEAMAGARRLGGLRRIARRLAGRCIGGRLLRVQRVHRVLALLGAGEQRRPRPGLRAAPNARSMRSTRSAPTTRSRARSACR